MLSIVPEYERARDRYTDRPFKSYPHHPSLSQSHTAANPYYNPFSNPTFLSSFQPKYQQPQSSASSSTRETSSSSATATNETAMDLRDSQQPSNPLHSMYDPRMYHDSGLTDMASHISHRIPNIKQENQNQLHLQQQNQHNGSGGPSSSSIHDFTYPHINTNPAHQGYTSLTAGMSSHMGLRPDMMAHMDMNNRGRSSTNTSSSALDMVRPEMGQLDMGSPPQASLAHIGNTASSPQATSQAAANLSNTIGLNSSSDRSDHSGPPSPDDSLSATSPPLTSTNITQSSRMPPKKRPISCVPDDLKDNTYWEKRKKNNESAKRSREARRMKEEQIAVRVVYLEQENLQLRTEVSLLKTEIEKLRVMLYNS